ncbi:hypothetical protein ABZ948_32515 [Streptomyces olindensis]
MTQPTDIRRDVEQPLLLNLFSCAGGAAMGYVIEQPNGRAEVLKDLTLRGEMFGLGVTRHRKFELGGWTAQQPVHVPHRGLVLGYRHGRSYDGNGGGRPSIAELQAAMGIDWTDVREELTEAISPAYTEHIGAVFLAAAALEVAA